MKFLILFFIATALFSDAFEHHNEKHISKEISHLNLSPEQNEKIKEVLRVFQKDLKEYRILKEDIDDKTKKIFIKDNFNEGEINELNKELYNKSKEVELKLLKNVHNILSRKQRADFMNYFDDWKVE